jgi:hypothetical protein
MNGSFGNLLGHSPFFIALIIFFPLAVCWRVIQQRTKKDEQYEDVPGLQKLPLRFGTRDYLKMFFSWLFLFGKTFSVRPGYYFTEIKDTSAPLLVTCNNFLTVFLLVRRIAQRNIRLLVIDTNGINVWCSAAEGRFSAFEIIEKANYYGLIKENKKTEMVLPKLCLSGVRLSDLKKAGIKPVIGPLFAKDVPEYLDKSDFTDRRDDHFIFGLQSRVFTALPTVVQFFYWFLGVYIVTFWFLESSIIWVAVFLAFFYPVLFPFLPGKQFAVKGISLGAGASILYVVYSLRAGLSSQAVLVWVLFIVATSIWIGLSYTGNSPVSNYEDVRKETAKYLPVVVMLYLLLIPVKILL